jgi:hypothetical protein
MKPNGRCVYALHGFTVEKRTKGWFFSPTAVRHEKVDWRGPYQSEASVTPIIARELRKEIVRRHERVAGAL